MIGDPSCPGCDCVLVWQRISSGNPNDQMLPPGSGKHRLDEHEIELVRQWIDAGAEYEPHWAFEPS